MCVLTFLVAMKVKGSYICLKTEINIGEQIANRIL